MPDEDHAVGDYHYRVRAARIMFAPANTAREEFEQTMHGDFNVGEGDWVTCDPVPPVQYARVELHEPVSWTFRGSWDPELAQAHQEAYLREERADAELDDWEELHEDVIGRIAHGKTIPEKPVNWSWL